MSPFFAYGEPRKKWVEYADGSFEPVNSNENIKAKGRGPGQPDWWVVDQEPGWRPEKYANTKRGNAAWRELGTSWDGASGEEWSKAPEPGAGRAEPTGMKDVLAKGKSGSGLSGRDGRAGSVGNMPLWGFGRDDALKGGSEAANDLDASAGGASALGRFTPAGFKGQHQDAAPTGSQSPEEADDALQPQYRNTGKAMAQLGGEDDGKVTLLNNDLTPAEKEPARQDASETQAENGSQPLASKPDSGKDQETETPPASEQATEEEEQKQPENVNQHLKLDAAGADFIKDSEGFRAKPYEDSAGHCTIGYGHLLHLGKCTQADFDAYPDGLTKKEAVDLFNSKAEEYQSAVRRLVTVPLTQAQYNALVSLVYNVGEGEFAKSRTLKNINSGNDELAKEEWLGFEYETKNGKKVKNKGLRERREREIKIFFGGE